MHFKVAEQSVRVKGQTLVACSCYESRAPKPSYIRDPTAFRTDRLLCEYASDGSTRAGY